MLDNLNRLWYSKGTEGNTPKNQLKGDYKNDDSTRNAGIRKNRAEQGNR
jgi:hypothetical protein